MICLTHFVVGLSLMALLIVLDILDNLENYKILNII
ncbi:hypothetical protein SAMN04515655_14511 [Halanaerobium congolense]|uniref:Uncharacterized protein n=1 Tax=Halanaerobium congolense TaxID=54121 RepID=A0A1M7PIL2_9FIRM|nr:hypothetical protein C8C79_12542 [Halanaerobium congolense]TDX39146.1 hypothetical protein C7954_1334 [Halanaerobium congolense]SDL02188.1 hypothetical protein SAMN04515655_14511 [Halanaerobium congolense]SDN09659.1 hypothetical protein SAMN04488599_14911 [Halanaerobium congolense]SHN17015.1 hypothetical protein SAMN04515650_13912 [Halanaerobium congolense]